MADPSCIRGFGPDPLPISVSLSGEPLHSRVVSLLFYRPLLENVGEGPTRASASEEYFLRLGQRVSGVQSDTVKVHIHHLRLKFVSTPIRPVRESLCHREGAAESLDRFAPV